MIYGELQPVWSRARPDIVYYCTVYRLKTKEYQLYDFYNHHLIDNVTNTCDLLGCVDSLRTSSPVDMQSTEKKHSVYKNVH